MSEPMVSIIVRTKDRPRLLKRALQSIVAQTYRPIEVVLVNDGGCELDIEEIIIMLGDVSLNYIRLETNTGRAHAGNIGIENAKGEYLGMLDDDDELYPDHIATLAVMLLNGPNMIAYADAETVFMELDADGNFIEKGKQLSYRHDFTPEVFFIQNYIPFMCLLFDRKVFSTIRLNESFDLFEDWDLLLRLSQKYRFTHISKITSKYNQWSDESQINRRANTEDFSKKAYLQVLQKNMDRITPEVLYAYCVAMNREKSRIIIDLNTETFLKQVATAHKDRIEAEKDGIETDRNLLKDETVRLETLRQQLQTELESNTQQFKAEKADLESARQKLQAEKDNTESARQRLQTEKEILFREFVGLQNYLAQIENSLSWKMIGGFRKIKERLAPTGTKRRAFYDMGLKSLRVITTEGFYGFTTRVKRRMRFSRWFMRMKGRLRRSPVPSINTVCSLPMDLAFSRKPVSIVMPVYNGFECIGDCINSILVHTDLSYHSLILINDQSTDPRITEYLCQLDEKKNGKHIAVLANEDNLGFVKTINRGMQRTIDDVIILNSDTVVTKGWVEKLQRAAYSKPRVATATPLSNYVTINGVPEPFKFNPVPLGMDVDSFGAFLERISLRYYPEVPAGVGFCMYIKRTVLDDLGYFDDAKFEKGYAEETDFCMRALKKGHLHVIDDATYIYHVGGVSFESVKDPEVLKAKNLMIERNLETLRELHPEYLDLVGKALSENLAPVHKYVRMRIEMEEKRV
jgi:GT2 family glycosyltransferase